MLFKFFKRAIITLLLIIFVVLGAGYIYEHICRLISSVTIQATGSFVNVEGHKLHYVKQGNSGPTVVFESGLDVGGHLPWYKVQNEVSKFAVTVSYDRAGILWSERGSRPKTCKDIAEELHSFLVKADIKKPYILVGHSMAGLTLRSFISRYPKEVAGVIFIDASHPDQLNRYPEELKSLGKLPPDWLIKFEDSIGVNRLVYKTVYPGTEADDYINDIVTQFYYKSISATLEEWNSFNYLLKEAGEIKSFGNIPLIVISGTSPNRLKVYPTERLRKQMPGIESALQKDLLNLSTNSRLVKADKSGHYIQLEQPEIIVESIRQMILNNNIKKY